VATVAEDDSINLMQKHTRVRTQGERIIAAAANHGSDTICVDVTAGNVAPMSGSFTAMSSQQAVVVAAGAIAESKGSFCVPKQELLLLQRTLGLHTAEEFEAAIGKKDPETTIEPVEPKPSIPTTTTDVANKKVSVEQCPEVLALLQTMDATVSKKKEKTDATGRRRRGAAPEEPKLTDDQKKVCTCRSFLPEAVHTFATLAKKEEEELTALAKKEEEELTGDLLQTLDGTVSKKGEDPVGTENYALFSFCYKLKVDHDWANAAAILKSDDAVTLFESVNMTNEACTEHWAIEGACGDFLKYSHDNIPAEDKEAIDTAVVTIVEEAAR